ncbi:TPA: hypothetical protein O5359_000251 [Staphylococcus aureus]|nr:hypothetical protein [Staphylococcus aureus]
MSVEIKGIPEVLNKLESVYGKQAMQAKSDKALNEASEFFIKALKKEFESFKDTGASIEEMTKSKPYTKALQDIFREINGEDEEDSETEPEEMGKTEEQSQ